MTDAIKQAARNHPAHILAPFDAMVGLDGLDAIIALCDAAGGQDVYIPSARTVFAACIERQLLHDFNGYNYADLAKKYGYSTRHVRRIIKANSP